MFHSVVMSNSTCVSEEPNISSGPRVQDFGTLTHKSPMLHNSIATNQEQPSQKTKKKRNLPGNPDPDAEVIALSPTTLLATNRFVCEICNKGFQRDQNLQLHRRGHNLPWKLKQRNAKDLNKKRAYVCPEATCVHHHPSRALGDLTGIKKHYCRKHGEKKWKCDKCSKIYAVQSDWKAHSKTCGTREYRCDCGTIFSRKDSFITHRAFCDALAEESARISAATITNSLIPRNNTIQSTTFHFNHHHNPPPPLPSLFPLSPHRHFPSPWDSPPLNPSSHAHNQLVQIKQEIPLSSPVLYQERSTITSPYGNLHIGTSMPPLSATALLQKAATVGLAARHRSSTMAHLDMHSTWHKNDHFTRDFLGLTGSGSVDQCDGSGSANMRDQLFKHQGGFEFAEACPCPGTHHWGNC